VTIRVYACASFDVALGVELSAEMLSAECFCRCLSIPG
jgi:hypothetical protein